MLFLIYIYLFQYYTLDLDIYPSATCYNEYTFIKISAKSY